MFIIKTDAAPKPVMQEKELNSFKKFHTKNKRLINVTEKIFLQPLTFQPLFISNEVEYYSINYKTYSC